MSWIDFRAENGIDQHNSDYESETRNYEMNPIVKTNHYSPRMLARKMVDKHWPTQPSQTHKFGRPIIKGSAVWTPLPPVNCYFVLRQGTSPSPPPLRLQRCENAFQCPSNGQRGNRGVLPATTSLSLHEEGMNNGHTLETFWASAKEQKISLSFYSFDTFLNVFLKRSRIVFMGESNLTHNQ